MARTALVTHEGQLALPIDRELQEKLGLHEGMAVELEFKNGRVSFTTPTAEGLTFDAAHDDISMRYEAMLKRLA